MLNRDALVELLGELGDRKVLSVYLDGRTNDFAERKLWRKRFEHELAGARARAAEAGAEDEGAFDAAAEHVGKALSEHEQFLPDRGWVAFATPERLVLAHALRVPMPDLVRWEPGIRVAPYIRALKQDRPVIGALLDSRRARVFEYRGGQLTECDDLVADVATDDLSSINVSKRATSHSGTRGKTGTDAHKRSHDVESERLLKRLSVVLIERAGDEGLLVVGGTPEAVSAAMTHLPSSLKERTTEPPSARVEMSEAEVREILEGAATRLTQAMQEPLLADVVDQARAGGKGALTPRDVEMALEEGRVDTLLLSRGFIQGNPDYADKLVGAAFGQGGEVEELAGPGGERLDREGQGVAARLRYVLAK